MEIKNLTNKELNALHYDLSYDAEMLKGHNLMRFYEIQNQMQVLRNEYKRRL